MNKFRKQLFSARGFTLVELLIVIALIAILSVAVLATINPIEQANKARDSAQQNDAAEILNAYERYYANSQKYPWMMYSDNLGVGNSVVLTSRKAGFGICYSPKTNSSSIDGTCNFSGTLLGDLINADELKASFAGKKPFQSSSEDDQLVVYKEGGSSSGSIYVCYVPRAKSSRILTSKLKCIVGGKLLAVGETNCAEANPNDTAAWTSAVTGIVNSGAGKAIFRCVPESEIAPTSTP